MSRCRIIQNHHASHVAILKLNFFEFNKPSQRVANLLKSTAYGKPTTVHLLRQESQSIVKNTLSDNVARRAGVGYVLSLGGHVLQPHRDSDKLTGRDAPHSINVANSLLCFRAHLLHALSWRIPLSSHLPRCHAPCTWVDRVSRVITGCGARVLITLSAIHGNSIPTKDERSRLLFFDNPFNYH